MQVPKRVLLGKHNELIQDVNIKSVSYMLQTHSLYEGPCIKSVEFMGIRNASLLLEPGSHLMTCPEVIEYQTEPACSQYYNCHNQLTYNADRLFKDVQYTPDSADNTC